MKLLSLNVLALTAISGLALAQPVQWNSGAGHTDKWYERISTTGQLTFDQAKTAAEALSFNGSGGQLVMFNGSDPIAEENWIRDNVVHQPGLPTGQSIYWYGATRADNAGVPGENWKWIDGTAIPTSVTATWNIDFFEGGGAPYSSGFSNNYGFDYGDYRQDDPTFRMAGYVVEYTAPTPSAIAAFGLAGLAAGRRRR